MLLIVRRRGSRSWVVEVYRRADLVETSMMDEVDNHEVLNAAMRD